MDCADDVLASGVVNDAMRIFAVKDIVTEIVNRTEGVSAAFVKELMRRAAQSAIERDPDGVVIVEDIDSTLQDMLFRGGRLNASLLGASAVAPG